MTDAPTERDDEGAWAKLSRLSRANPVISVLFSHTSHGMTAMPNDSPARSVKKAISLPPDLARFAIAIAREEGKTLSAVVQDAVRAYRLSRLRAEYGDLQHYWSRRAREKGVLTERQLERYLKRGE